MPKTTTTERTWRIQFFTDRDAVPRIEYLRERVKTYPDGDVVAVPCGVVVRSLTAELAATTLPTGTTTVRTFGDLAALLASCGHALAEQDAAIAAARKKAEDDAAAAVIEASKETMP